MPSASRVDHVGAAADYERVAELLTTEADLKVGFVGCAMLAVTERLGEAKLAMLPIAASARCTPPRRGA